MPHLDLVAELRRIANEGWAEYSAPVLLARIPAHLKNVQPADYKEALGEYSLKKFILETALGGGYQLVTHPAHGAKVGIMPAQESYEFPNEESTADPISRQDVEGFTRVLQTLNAEELRQVALPATLIVRLLSNR